MKKVAIVGVEGSGKTVMLAGLGDLYTYPDEEGYFLSPKNFSTAAYVAEKIGRMRKGEWPAATAGDEMQGLDWTLERKVPGVRRPPEKICEVSFLDFAGEVYRTAFGIGAGDQSLAEQAEELKRYVQDADDLIVLINLRDVIVHGIRDRRVQEAMWITNAILDAALAEEDGRKAPRAAIVLSQADSYADTIKDCGGALGVLRKHLPHVANRYDWLDVFAASAVDKTKLDDGGNVVPEADFTSKGLLPILAWIRGENIHGGDVQNDGRRVAEMSHANSASETHVYGSDERVLQHKAGDLKTITLPGGIDMRLRWCPPGTFKMGGDFGLVFRCPLHEVTISKGFWLGETQVTQAQWESVMHSDPSYFKGRSNRPVERVSWEDCQSFVKKVNEFSPCGARLPTEAEWEYACRAGKQGRYGGTGMLDDMGWYEGNSGGATYPVGQKKPNDWGLYDMHGNVEEWCADWCGDYPEMPVVDPTGPVTGSERVYRGGRWNSSRYACRAEGRRSGNPTIRWTGVGFRLCCTAQPNRGQTT